jgi:AraC-like DNA-binding protein/mannose-6-phosphate isomerase-like protein (cupin superfamily)
VELLNPQSQLPLDGILSALRVQSTVFCRSDLRAPWGFAVRPRDVSVFHIVVSGSCWLQVDDGDATRFAAGEFALVPKGSGHVVRDDPSSPVCWLDDLLRDEPFDGTLRHGGNGARTELLCGGFTVGGHEANPVLAALPDVLHVSAGEDWLAPTVQLIRDELARPAHGTDAVLARLSDVLLVQAIRAAVAGDERQHELSALRDREISRALTLVHESPEHSWTVSELARAVALSRSAFSARFRELVGESPMRYVRRCRLTRAAELLRHTDASLVEIALASGYQSDVSLSKAFKRAFAVSPGRYRASEAAGAIVAG